MTGAKEKRRDALDVTALDVEKGSSLKAIIILSCLAYISFIATHIIHHHHDHNQHCKHKHYHSQSHNSGSLIIRFENATATTTPAAGDHAPEQAPKHLQQHRILDTGSPPAKSATGTAISKSQAAAIRFTAPPDTFAKLLTTQIVIGGPRALSTARLG